MPSVDCEFKLVASCPGPGSGSAGKSSGGILGGFMSRSRRNSNDSLDTLRDVEFRG